MQTLTQIRALLDAHGLKPRHRLGQNFLHDKNLLRRLIEAAGITPGELVLEVGPGTGTLTEGLVACGAEVVACEIDPGLAAIVREGLGARVQLVEGDCLGRGRRLAEAVERALARRPFTLVANLPYQVASTLIVTLLVQYPACHGQFVTIQREVADRLGATPGTKTYGALTVIVGALAEVSVIARLGPACFWPRPTVGSAMVAIRPRSPAEHGIESPATMATFVTALFGRRRKQLGTIFGRDTRWPPGITGDLRPDALSIDQIVALSCLSMPS